MRRLWRHRDRFGITRMGALTRLDRIGIPVVQVTRPRSRSNAVSQGKGLTVAGAAVSALMESLECWSAETVAVEVLSRRRPCEAEDGQPDLFEPAVYEDHRNRWKDMDLPWIEGWDFLAGKVRSVPVGLVDTDYSWPPRPDALPFVRTTTGLAAGNDIGEAFVHAALEVIERHCVAQAHGQHGFFDDNQLDLSSIDEPEWRRLVAQMDAAGFAVGLWQVPAPAGIHVMWCHIIDRNADYAQLPLPSEGFACAFDPATAARAALLEAVQARMSALSGAREDIARQCYPAYPDRERLKRWCGRLDAPFRTTAAPSGAEAAPARVVDRLRAAFTDLGARMAVVVPLARDRFAGFCTLSLVAPDLRPAPGLG